MDTSSNDLEGSSFTEENSTSDPTVNIGSLPHEGEKEDKVGIKSDFLEPKSNDQTQNATVTLGVAASTSLDPVTPSKNVKKEKDRMDTEQSVAKDESAEIPCSQSTVVLPVDEVVGVKNGDRKSRARTSSESSQTPPSNKLAKLTPRTTRSSQNPDFAAKQRKFLNRVHDPIRNNSSDNENCQGSPASVKGSKEIKPKSNDRKSLIPTDSKKKTEKESTPKRPADSDDEGSAKKKKVGTKEPTKIVDGVDSYCWRCHRDGQVIRCDCAPCPRVYHVKCVQLDKPPDHPWMCPECSLVTQAEDMDTRSRAMRMLSLDQLCTLLRFALNRMKSHEGAEDFAKPVDLVQFPHYRDYIVKPMDLSQLERNIRARLYGSTEAFLADAKWIVHNSIIFNSVQSKFTNTARALLKLCRQEMQHIENCPDCYQNSHTRASDSWFTEACRRPHILVWAKLKGFPFWPAKVMSVNNENNQVDVRFFGAHDRAWIPLNQCFLYSKLSPTPTTNNKNKRTLEDCLQEVEYHIKRLRDKFGHFEYAPYKTPYDPKNEDEQLLMMLPQYESKIVGKRGRLLLHHDGARKSLGRRATSPRRSPEKPTTEETPSDTSTANGSETPGQPMVVIPVKPKGPATKTPARTPTSRPAEDGDRPATSRPNSTPTMKKKTPLTAAAKKCFAMDKVCANCDSRTATLNEDSLCTNCSKETHEGKRCVCCGTTITMVWLTDAVGRTVCSSCSYSERQKKEERGGEPTSTVRGTVTVERRRPTAGQGDGADEAEPEGGAQDTGAEPAPSGCAEDSAMDIPTHEAVDNSAEPAKKISIVDRLQEKLCFTVIEALKDQMTPEEVQAIEAEKEVDSSPEKTNDAVVTRQDTASPVVVLHDLRNDKEILNRMTESDRSRAESRAERNEENSASEAGSEVETDASSGGDSDVIITDDSKRKKKNINNVVQNLKERKSSTDDQSERGKSARSNTMVLDDSAEEASILIIDEGESNESKKSSGKSDKSRRKGIPAKVQSRSSTESSEDNRLSKAGSVEVLDEASGHFRRVSTDNDRPVTITLVTEGEKPQKKAKEIRSVNISKSLSLCVIKDSEGLEMECAESDADDVIVDSVKKVMPRPTARKTLPNPPRLANLDKRPSPVPPTSAQQPPPLVSLRQPKPSAPAKPPPGPAPARAVVPPVKLSPRAEVGPAHAKLEEIVQKVVTFMRSSFEEMLRASVEVSGENAAAMRESHQLEIERLKWQHKQEMAELRHNTDLIVNEIRATMEAEKQRAQLDLKHKMEIDKEQAISETKRKQWCAFCQKEAQLYCCWNTAYCSYNCQQEHWAPHMNDCRNKQSQEEVAQPHRNSHAQTHDLDSVRGCASVVVRKRKRCGLCTGCLAEPCGKCHPCTDRRTHSVCVFRQCSLLTRKIHQRSRQQELMPPPAAVPPYRFQGPQHRGLHQRRGPPLFYPSEGFCPQCP